MKNKYHPRTVEKSLLTCEVADELLVYDLVRHKAHCLNSTAALVWRHCDGRSGVSEITRAVNHSSDRALTEDVVSVALEQLARARLIEDTYPRHARMTRRELIKTAGAAAAAGLPLVTSITAPTAVEAATCAGPGAPCAPNGPNGACCSGLCVSGNCT
ncbi:MAG: PqqD family protein [Blastocatellia bacterium]